MTGAKALPLFTVAAVAEIGGAWLVWQGTRAHRGALFIGARIAAFDDRQLVAVSDVLRTSAGCRQSLRQGRVTDTINP